MTPLRALAAGALLALAACTAPGAPSPPADAPPAPAAARSAELPAPDVRRVIGHSVGGRPLLVHDFPGDGPVVALLATLHGNEGAGTPLLERLADELRAHPERRAGRRVMLLPVANPDGYASGTRGNARGVDLNRGFPAANARPGRHGDPLAEPESRALHAWLTAAQPDLVISVHQPLALVDWDGPAEELARAFAASCGLPARQLGSRPGSLGSFLGVDHGVPVITLELPPDAGRHPPQALWERYGEALLQALESVRDQRSTFS